MFKKTTLKNNLRLITVPLRDVESVTVLILFATGSKYECKDKNGISHFVEHMMFKGTKKRPNTFAISEELDRIGGSFNAYTSKEYTGYYVKAARTHLDTALDVLSDMVINSKFSSGEIKKEKGVIIEEINMYQDMPQRYVRNLFVNLLYGDQPAGWDITGTKETVVSLKRGDFLNYFNRQYIAENAVVVISGKFEEKSILKKAKRYFSGIRSGKPKDKEPVVEIQTKPETLIHHKKTDQTHVALGVRAYDMFDERRFALFILSLVLGGSMSSRLSISVREKQGLAYYIRSSENLLTDSGYLVTFAGVDNKRVEKAVISILKEYKKIRDKGITNNEFKKAKDYFKGTMLIGIETSDEWADWVGDQELFRREIMTPEQILGKINAVSRLDVWEVAKDIFTPEKLNLALIGPFDGKKDKKRFDKLLNI